ncbi:MAG: sigma-70 family RNA polymerase sigma factor [bacterium]|nr:sigma-70 family RNA polymerase sigma factor [bacterium]
MSSAELFTLIQGTENSPIREVFENYYGRLIPIANRYAKNQQQAEELFHQSFNACVTKMMHPGSITLKNSTSDLDQFFYKEFILEAIRFIKNIRSEYYVASTVYAPGENSTKNYNLFENNDLIDFAEVENDVLIKCLQLLVPSQRLVFNLHVVDGFTLEETANMLESSEGTVKSNLEKARFNLQKNIEKTLKSVKV